MKVGLFWLGPPSAEVASAVGLLRTAAAMSDLEQFVMFTGEGLSGTTPFVRKAGQHTYDTLNDLQDVYEHAQERELDFAVISFGNGFPASLSRLSGLLKSKALQKAIWSFRICNITGAGFRHWPRRPIVDDHFIVLNVGRAADAGFFQRKLVHASHFGQAGGRHAHLSSMIEYALEEGEFNNHFVADASRDQRGRVCRFDPMPFHLCETTGFMSCYADFKPALRNLLERNLENRSLDTGLSLDKLRYLFQGGFWFFRPFINPSTIINLIKRPFGLGKYEFQKQAEFEV